MADILERLQHYRCDKIGEEYEHEGGRQVVPAGDPDANLASSVLADDPSNRHLIVLDIDMPCELRPSETPGHHHLIIDKALTWDEYEKLLGALADAGIVERGYVNAAEFRGATFIALKPWKNRAAAA